MSARPQFRLSAAGSVLNSRELPEPMGPGDANLLAAIGCLSQFPHLLERVAPPDQSFETANGYCGMFRYEGVFYFLFLSRLIINGFEDL